MILSGACGKSAPGRGRSPLRQRIDQQRVQLWFQWIQLRSRGGTYYALEKQLIGDGFSRNADGVLSHRHRMARYAQGKHVPRSALIERAELAFPRSRDLLENVYWDIIDPEKDLMTHRPRWLAGLGPETQRVQHRSGSRASEFMVDREKPSRRLLRRLEHQGSFEALAATALLLREAQAEDHESLAYQCAQSFWVILLLIGSTVPFINLLPPMAALAGEALIDQVQHDDEQVEIATAPVRLYEQILRHHCLAREDRGLLDPRWNSWVRYRLQLMRGDYGFDLLFALGLPTRATKALHVDPARYLAFQRDAFVRWKALDYITQADWAKRSFMDDWVAYMGDPEGRWPELSDGSAPLAEQPSDG